MTLFYSNRRPEDSAFLVELVKMDEQNERFRLIPTMSGMEESEQVWDGETGRIDGDLLERHIEDLQKPVFYLAGPPPMVSDTTELLAKIGVPREHIQAEKFSGY